MRASALGSQPDGMRWCDRILERMTGSHKQNSIRSSRQSSPRRKRRLPKRVYIMRRVVVLLVTVLWIVVVWLSVAGEARALFQARNLQASSNAGAASRWKPTHFHDAQIERANTERSESAEHSENTHAEQDAQAIAALEAPLSDEQRHEILDKARQAAYEDNKTPVVLHYCVATNGNVGSAEGFANTVFRVLNNPQGWPRAGVIFAPTHDTNACEFTIMLAESSKLAEYSQGCSAEYSCRVGTDVIINKKRWDEAVEHWFAHGETLSQYRTMVLNHEVGHVLGHVDNETVCEGEGKRAPLMQEQSMDLRGCTPNAWPLDNELWTAY